MAQKPPLPAMAETPKPDTPITATDKARFCGKKRRSGPPQGNTNALRHGLNAGKLPRKLQYIELKVNALRRHLEDAVLKAKGEIGIVDAATLNSALKWERHARLAENWLRHEADKLSAADRLKFSEAIAKASDQRDKNLRLLGLDAHPEPWAMVDGNIPTNCTSDEGE